jgi:hypothetical protein
MMPLRGQELASLLGLCENRSGSEAESAAGDHIGKRNSLVLSGGFNVIRRIGLAGAASPADQPKGRDDLLCALKENMVMMDAPF